MIDEVVPSFYNMTLFGFCLITPVKSKKGIDRSGGVGTPPYLNIFFIGESSGVGKWSTKPEQPRIFDEIYCRN